MFPIKIDITLRFKAKIIILKNRVVFNFTLRNDAKGKISRYVVVDKSTRRGKLNSWLPKELKRDS
tara:strand:+ start:32 stop:226 length:195 start_codon:yes stop_codon:yes gene_type:complete